MRLRGDHPVWPWAWSLCIPLVTVPATLLLWQAWLVPQCRGAPGPAPAPYTCLGASVAVALLPGLLNLVPLAWAACPTPATRVAALLVGGLGIVRWVVPTVRQGGTLPSVTIHPVDALLQIPLSVGLWGLTLLLGAGYLLWWLRSRDEPPPP
jgi:hypothetical protein